jgi:hypothetical protein
LQLHPFAAVLTTWGQQLFAAAFAVAIEGCADFVALSFLLGLAVTSLLPLSRTSYMVAMPRLRAAPKSATPSHVLAAGAVDVSSAPQAASDAPWSHQDATFVVCWAAVGPLG